MTRTDTLSIDALRRAVRKLRKLDQQETYIIEGEKSYVLPVRNIPALLEAIKSDRARKVAVIKGMDVYDIRPGAR